MRTRKSVKNIVVTFALQGLSILISFFARQYFISRLGMSYLGLNGIFDNVLNMLSLAELGFSTAFMFALFKPIAAGDHDRIRALMRYFRKIYMGVGAVILTAGLAVVPLLHLFITTDIPFGRVILYYVLYLAAVCVTYLFSYKKTLLIACQDKYVSSVITYTAFCLLSGFQVLLLLLTGSYTLFLAALIVSNLAEGLVTNAVSDRRYVYLKEKTADPVPAEERAFIARNVRALFFHRIGGVVINGTDNIVISAFIGLVQVGIYSNYLLALNALSIVLNQVFAGLTASVGNLGAEDNKKRYYEVYCAGLYVNALLFIPLTAALWFVADDFVVWLTQDGAALLDRASLACVLAVFLLNGLRRITASYREAQALYWYDRYKPIAESVINLGVSIWLARTIGMAGVFIGTLVSLLATSFWVEPYVLFKYGFGRRLREYFVKYLLYCLAGAVSFAAVLGVRAIVYFGASLPALIADSVLYLTVAGAVFILCTFWLPESREIWSILSGLFGRRGGRRGGKAGGV